jgi:hypothetical protein
MSRATFSMKLRSTPRPAVAAWHGDENDLGIIDTFLGAGGEPKPVRRDILVDHFLEARL